PAQRQNGRGAAQPRPQGDPPARVAVGAVPAADRPGHGRDRGRRRPQGQAARGGVLIRRFRRVFSMRTVQRGVVILLGVAALVAGVRAAAPPSRKDVVPDLRPLLEQPRSEMAEVVRRYEADRGSLQRTYPILASPTRRTRLARFYAAWLAALWKLDAD